MKIAYNTEFGWLIGRSAFPSRARTTFTGFHYTEEDLKNKGFHIVDLLKMR